MAMPSKYDAKRSPEIARMLARAGLIMPELAKVLGIGTKTLDRWRHAHPEFREALSEGKDYADARVIQSLYRRALGYSHRAVKIMVCDKQPVKVHYIEHYPPDTVACIFWLKNRRPHEWRDRREVEVDSKPQSYADMTDEQLDTEIARLEAIYAAHKRKAEATPLAPAANGTPVN